MTPASYRKLTLLDALLLVASACIGLGLFELTHRTLFNGWIWLIDNGLPDTHTWTTMGVLVFCTDITVFNQRSRFSRQVPSWRIARHRLPHWQTAFSTPATARFSR
jgi:hypothetical protein